ncbi:translational GTPase TypA [Rubripirellula amarantea]|uniref:Large ribosomal subunit assembly factor BipA n=1 Tax=Rubripirellula amarantea TaxID=2527999 RepID=A0A5C5WH27_9BACT|nr:translational GTPase TypA [Rubripirellula amarantea]MDA8746424.1 translational GTPase TypA [Rubripirellula amarantea]TWT49409.1 GTP-binding protein TypA/BipA [Rubripirellula amarantea]
MRREDIRNIVIIAHVDHGKTTLVDCLLRQSGQYRDSELKGERILDSNDLERERGITILAKNIAIPYRGVKINLIDTPGHADFGGEVERVVKMADGCLVLVDAAEGPMPQTRFVLEKALEAGVRPIIVVNKVDRPDGRPTEALDEALELLADLGGEEQLDHVKYVYTSAKEGYATTDPTTPTTDMRPLLDLFVDALPGPEVDMDAPLQMMVTTLDWSEYVGRIAVGRIQAGTIVNGSTIDLHTKDGPKKQKITGLFTFNNLGRVATERASAGDVVAVEGLQSVEIGDTISEVDANNALPRLKVDEPTLEMVFSVNTSPLVGREGKYVTTRQLKARLEKELERNVALRVEMVEGAEAYAVKGRGVLHLAILIETMRREGFELSVGKPRVINREVNGKMHEPFETLAVEVPADAMGPVMELVGHRRGQLDSMSPRGEYMLLKFFIPSRGLIGLRTRLLNATRGTAIINHRFSDYREMEGEVPRRSNGVLVSMVSGKTMPFAMFGLQDRSELLVPAGTEVYEGMIVGENVRDNDLVVNPCREKQLTNMRASGSDENVILKPPRDMSLEAALEYIEEDELVEVTPENIRLRKILLKESDRRRVSRNAS